MKKINTCLLTATLAATMFACQNTADQSKSNESQTTNELKPLVEKVLSEDEQAALTPDEIIEMLKSGNKRFMSSNLTARDHSAQVRNSTFGQYPKAVILSCLDSRVPVSDVFDCGIGDIFVGRIAGNFVNVDMLGSMEYGCKISGAKLILVMGHEHCGAVKAAIDDLELGNITAMLAKIKPAVELVSDFEGEKTSNNDQFVHEVCESNVKNTINEIRINSPILKEMEENWEIKIIGAVYNMSTGEVMFLD